MSNAMNEPPSQGDTLANLYATAADQARELGHEAHDLCVDAAPLVGDLTGKMYGFGTMKLTDSPEAAKFVDTVIDAAVTRGWPDTCDLPMNLTAAATDAAAVLGENAMPLLDSLANLIGEIVTDVRQEVVEQGWFGRTGSGPDSYDGFLGDRYCSPPDPATGPSVDQSPSLNIDLDY